jgi:pimeloyl-ACP methyl ester carboxylesterase
MNIAVSESPSPVDRDTGERFEWRGHGGLRLCGERWGRDGDGPVLFLHGGGQTRHAWAGAAQRVAYSGYEAMAIDMRGHGDSDWAPDSDYSVEALAADLAALSVEDDRAPILVGASMGGITALVGVGEGKLACRALVLVDIAPRIEPVGVARIVAFMRGHPDGFESLEAARAAVAAYNPHRRQAGDSSGLRKNLRLGEDGRYRWHWDPRLLEHPERSDPAMMERQQERRIAAAARINVPTLLVRGTRSDIVSDEGVRELRALIPHAEVVEVAQAGHMVAGDRNDLFSEAILAFICRK